MERLRPKGRERVGVKKALQVLAAPITAGILFAHPVAPAEAQTPTPSRETVPISITLDDFCTPAVEAILMSGTVKFGEVVVNGRSVNTAQFGLSGSNGGTEYSYSGASSTVFDAASGLIVSLTPFRVITQGREQNMVANIGFLQTGNQTRASFTNERCVGPTS